MDSNELSTTLTGNSFTFQRLNSSELIKKKRKKIIEKETVIYQIFYQHGIL